MTQSELNKARRQRLKAAGLCVCCGHRPALDGVQYCDTCRQAQRTATRKLREKRKERGVCMMCRTPLPADRSGKWLCKPCSDAAYNSHVRSELKRAGHHWIITGERMEHAYQCSDCGAVYMEQVNTSCGAWRYCPACGRRKMT